MGRRPKEPNVEAISEPKTYRKARTAEGRESQCIALSYDLVEKRLREGTATSQETVHFLRMGSPSERKKAELLDKQIAYIDAKIKNLESAEDIKALYADAIQAVTSYRSSIPRTGELVDE